MRSPWTLKWVLNPMNGVLIVDRRRWRGEDRDWGGPERSLPTLEPSKLGGQSKIFPEATEARLGQCLDRERINLSWQASWLFVTVLGNLSLRLVREAESYFLLGIKIDRSRLYLVLLIPDSQQVFLILHSSVGFAPSVRKRGKYPSLSPFP